MQLPDTANQELFADCQLQVWAITSISELTVASYTEDSFGVVQRVSAHIEYQSSFNTFSVSSVFIFDHRDSDRVVSGTA